MRDIKLNLEKKGRPMVKIGDNELINIAGHVLHTLFSSPEKLVSYDTLINTIWGGTYPVDFYSKSVLKVHTCHARKFLREIDSEYKIVTKDREGLIITKK